MTDSSTGLLPRGLSPSRAADFMQCPLLFRFRAIDRLPEPATVATARGTLVHGVLEDLFALPHAERTLVAATELVPSVWAQLRDSRSEIQLLVEADVLEGASGASSIEDQILQSAGPLLEAYFSLEDPRRLTPDATEIALSVDLPEQGERNTALTLRGVVDRLEINPAGDIRVVDYKTGRSPGSGFEGKVLFQMKFYALLVSHAHGRLPKVLQLLFLGDSTILQHSPDEREMVALERKVRALWAAIENAHATDTWVPSPGKLCSWCSFQDRCPAFADSPST